MNDLQFAFDLPENALGSLTSFVQFGFIIGTLLFALLSIADRFSPSKVFLVCALLGAAFNLGVIWEGNQLWSILILRFLTGFFLAGIYPVGMKIAADHFEKGLGKSLGFLVGALVLGTAFPHLLKDIKGDLPWELVLIATSLLATIGGALMLFLVPDGPYRKAGKGIQLSAIFHVFKKRSFRASAFGYFGHMWELYTFWAFVPIILGLYAEVHPALPFNSSLLSFFVIGIGGPACVLSGLLATRFQTKTVALFCLLMSGLCCLVSPWAISLASAEVFLLFLIFWGIVVIADSPLFSTLVANNAPVELKGTALTIVNSIGFFITILSIQLISYLHSAFSSPYYLMVLAIGPAFGLLATRGKKLPADIN